MPKWDFALFTTKEDDRFISIYTVRNSMEVVLPLMEAIYASLFL